MDWPEESAPLPMRTGRGSTRRRSKSPAARTDDPICKSPANVGRFGNGGLNRRQTAASNPAANISPPPGTVGRITSTIAEQNGEDARWIHFGTRFES